jgi:predicted O-methyltransferase YrrM
MHSYALLGLIVVLSLATFIGVLSRDLRRRHLSFPQIFRISPLARIDLFPAAFASAMATALVVALAIGLYQAAVSGRIPGLLPTLLALILLLLSSLFFWQEGRREIQFQRPTGLVFGEFLIIFGILYAISNLFPPHAHGPQSHLSRSLIYSSVSILVGVALILYVVPPFLKKYEGLRILERVGSGDQFLQAESTPPTPECPNPELWKMRDTQSTEVEVLDFLTQLVITIKPKLIVETGTFLGYGTLALAAGLKANGFGKLITVEFDPDIRARALERIEASGLAPFIESRLESSLDTVIPGTIDLLFSDSHLANREAEIRRLLPQLDPRGVLVIHDASSHFKIVREAALRLESEGLISAVLLSTPRGVVVAQRRAGRV